jgi:hypothetical protein
MSHIRNIQNSRQEKNEINFQFLGSFVIDGLLIRRQTQWKDTRRIFQGIGQMLISFGVILHNRVCRDDGEPRCLACWICAHTSLG